MAFSHRALSDDQVLCIDELRRMEYDLQLRLSDYIRRSSHDMRFNTRALEYAQERLTEAMMWAKKGVANEGIRYQHDE